MNITEHFVFVHMPKTGGSFVSEVLRRLHDEGQLHELALRSQPLLAAKNRLVRLLHGGKPAHEEFDKHGTCHDIPPAAAQLPILSCMRNPFDWYVSNYKYAWWRSNPASYPGLRDHPRWPDLSFDDYLQLSNTTWLQNLNPNISVNPTLGRLTVLFINYYCRHPEAILTLQDDDLPAAVKADMFPVHFMNTANLNKELHDYLWATGAYAVEALAFILSKEKVSPRNQRRPHEKWADFYTTEQKAGIRNRDRLLFQLFPHFDT